MNYIVLDLEWNQQIKKHKKIIPPIKLPGEIIQFGAVKLDEDCTVTDTFKIMVSPVYYKEMNEKVAEITNITTEDLQEGYPFAVALEKFRNWCADDFVFIIWGFEDIDILRKNMLIHKIDTSWLPASYNLQVIFDSQISKENRQISLTRAMEMIGEPALGAHDALNDAINTARILPHLDMKKGIYEYDQTRKKSVQDPKVIIAEKPDKLYSSRRFALKDKELTRFYHPDFDEEVVCTGFVEQGSTKYMAIGRTVSGKELLVRFNFRKWAQNELSVSRLVYEMNDENKKYYLKRKKRVQKSKTKYYKKYKRAT